MAIQVLVPLSEKDLVFRQGLFQLNPPFRVGEILLRNVKFSLRSSEIAAAVGGFNFIQAIGLDFICIADFILDSARISLKQGSVAADNQLPQSLFFMKFQYNLTKDRCSVHLGQGGCANRVNTQNRPLCYWGLYLSSCHIEGWYMALPCKFH